MNEIFTIDVTMNHGRRRIYRTRYSEDELEKILDCACRVEYGKINIYDEKGNYVLIMVDHKGHEGGYTMKHKDSGIGSTGDPIPEFILEHHRQNQ